MVKLDYSPPCWRWARLIFYRPSRRSGAWSIRNDIDNAGSDTADQKNRRESLLGLAIFATTGFLNRASTRSPRPACGGAAQSRADSNRTLQPAEGASVKILAPVNDQSFSGDQVELRFKLTKGKQGHHAHAYVDGELMGMFEGSSGTLNGIKPGNMSWNCAWSPTITRPNWTPATK